MAFGGGKKARVKGDINVTPLVDVVLVLLIIFLVALPVVMRDLDLDVPNKAQNPPDVMQKQITVEVIQGGRLLLNGVEIERVDLATKLRDRLEGDRNRVVFVGFDDATRYGDAVSIMDTVKGAGAVKVALKMPGER